MGCTQSKIENEEAVARCKERKQFMKEAVSARNAFAAAHSSYAMYLKNTGAALSDYAQGEVQNPLLPNPAQPNSSSAAAGVPFVETFRPPPPPPTNYAAAPPPAPLQRAATMPEIKIPKHDSLPKPKTIMEEDEEEDENENEGSVNLRRRRSSRGGSRGGHRDVPEEVQESNRPPPPAVSQENRAIPTSYQQHPTYDYFFNVDTMPKPTLSEMEDVDISREEIDRNMFDERSKRVDEEEEVKSSAEVELEPVPEKAAVAAEPPPPPDPEAAAVAAAAAAAAAAKNSKKGKQVASGAGDGKRMVKGNVNFLQVFVDLDDHFLKASESAHEVSKMLEATRLHYHSNFADNRGHIDHSARVMRVITWNRSFRGLANNDDVNDDFESEEHETHATVLDKLLAWEKKLYDEVKAGELMKFEYQKKVNALNRLKKRGTNSDALEKAKAAVSHLHTRYIVDMQSLDSTVSEINRLRDEQLYPKLVQLVDGMATMWETMRHQHESQFNIVQALRYLDIAQSTKETSEHHHERTMQLHAVVNEWHLQFQKLVNKQKDYIKALNTWLKLNLIPTESSMKEKVSSPPRHQTPPIQKLLIEWQDHLEKVPDELARSAISNFAAVIETIVHQQDEEMRLREKCEETGKELERKKRQFEDWYNKYMQRQIPEDGETAEDTAGNGIIVERQFVVDSLQKRLEEDREAYRRHCLQVREKSLVSLKTRLPELFRALLDFSVACTHMYGDLRSRSLPQHHHQSSAK